MGHAGSHDSGHGVGWQLALLAVAVLALPGCVESGPRVELFDYNFTPDHIEVHLGEILTFMTRATADHEVIVRHERSDEVLQSFLLPSGASQGYRFEAAGGYVVTCGRHVAMRLDVTVR